MAAPDFESRFRTHAHYVEALAWIAGLRGTTSPARALDGTRRRVGASGVLNDSPVARAPESAVRTRLTNAWGTELLLALAGQWDTEDEFVRITNTWGVVQAYYVGYHATQALCIAKGYDRPTNHPRTRNLYADFWLNRRLDLPPWSFGMRGERGPCNLPDDVSIDPTVHTWQNIGSETAWSVTAKALNSTRNEELKGRYLKRREQLQKDRRRAWNDEEETRLAAGRRGRRTPQFGLPLLSAAEKDRVDSRLRAFGILDYLHRLRIRANYDDAALFTDGPTDEGDSARLRRHLLYLTSATCFVTELRVQFLVGPRNFNRWMDEFIEANVPPRLSVGIALRRELFASAS